LPDVTVVIEILPASGGVGANRLDSAGGGRIYADVFPRRRNLQVINSGSIRAAEFSSIGPQISKASFRRSGSANAGRTQFFESSHDCFPERSVGASVTLVGVL
jgi:hypothetical protein